MKLFVRRTDLKNRAVSSSVDVLLGNSVQRSVAFVVCFVAIVVMSAQSKTVDSLSIDGLSINKPSVVRNTILLREGKEFNPNDLQESIKKLYALGLFSNVDIFITNESDSSVNLKLQLEENVFCEGIEFTGNKKFKGKEFEEKLSVKRGQVITDLARFNSKKAIEAMYAEKGLLLTEVTIEEIATKVPGNAILKFSIKEGPLVQVKKITFKGNSAISSKKLHSKLKTKENKWWGNGDYDEELFRSHLDTLVMFYNDEGFLDASIIHDSVYYSESKKDLFIDISIEEGKKYLVGDFFFSGNRVVETDTLMRHIALRKNKPFQKNRFEMTKYLVENAYREQGFLWVQVNDQRAFRGDTIDVTFNIYEGRAAIVNKIDIKGNTKTMEKVIRREVDLIPGEKYKQSVMARSLQKINALNYFTNPTPDLAPNNDGTIDLVYSVTEKDNIGQLSVGAAYSEQDGFVGQFSTSIPNFRGAGQKLDLNLEYGENRANANIGFTEPWAFDTPTYLFGNIFYTRSNYVYYNNNTTESYGFRVGVGRSKLSWPDDRFKVNAFYQFSKEETTKPTETYDNIVVRQDGFLSKVEFNVERYDFDMPMFPNSGSKISLVPEVTLGGDFSYLKGTLGYDHYFQLPAKFVLGSRSKVGLMTGLGDTIKPTWTDFYTLGGVLYSDADLRGYEEGTFGGYNNPRSGLSMFSSTLELRYPLIEQQLYIGAFGDIGNTWGSFSDINFSDLYSSVGAGVRINVPMLGLMGFDFGYGFKNPDTSNKANGWKFHFLMNRGF